MTEMLQIEKNKCIECGRCIEVCPSLIIIGEDNNSKHPTIANEQMCIGCGHCVAICPQGAIEHKLFPTESIHAIDRSLVASADSLMSLCKSRRSNRAFNDKLVPMEYVKMILEAAHRAPTASNLQQVEFTVVSSTEMLRFISNYTIEVFESAVRKLENPILKPILKNIMPDNYRYIPAFKKMRTLFDSGRDMILRDGKVVILIHTPNGNRFGCQDSNLAYQNGSLMAEALDVSHFYAGFVCSALKQQSPKPFLEKLQIRGTVHAAMVLGMPKYKFEKYIDKKELKYKTL